MICQLCAEPKKLIEAHIIPRSSHELLKSTSRPMLKLGKDPNIYPIPSHTGEYDRELFCKDCDNTFSPWENYTRNLLLQELTPDMIRSDGTGLRFYRITNYDYAAVKLALLSVLWRMSLSKRPSFAGVHNLADLNRRSRI